MEKDGTLCDEVGTVRELTYLGDRVSAGGGCLCCNCQHKLSVA